MECLYLGVPGGSYCNRFTRGYFTNHVEYSTHRQDAGPPTILEFVAPGISEGSYFQLVFSPFDLGLTQVCDSTEEVGQTCLGVTDPTGRPDEDGALPNLG